MENKSEVPAFSRLYNLHKRESSKDLKQRGASNERKRGQSIEDDKGEKYYKIKGGREDSARRREVESHTFVPSIHKKSKSLVRNEKVEDILYKDA